MTDTLIGFSMGSRKNGKGRVPVRWKYLPTPPPELFATTVLVASNEVVTEEEDDERQVVAVACLACGYLWEVGGRPSDDLSRCVCPVCRQRASVQRPRRTLSFVRRKWREARCRATWRRKWLRRDWR